MVIDLWNALIWLGAAVCLVTLWLALLGPRRPRRRRGRCGGCGYELNSVADGKCPECGGNLLVVGIRTRRRARTGWALATALLAWTLLLAAATPWLWGGMN